MFDWVFHFYNVRWRALVVGTLNDVLFTSTTELPDFYLKGDSVMKTLLASAGLALLFALATEPSASAQEPPDYFKQTLSDQALKPHWEEQLAVMNPKGALDGKTKQLIGLAVAAQIPCVYCVYGHTKLAKAAGATDAQIQEAIETAALVRFNSTMLQGSGYDLQKFQQEVDRLSAPK